MARTDDVINTAGHRLSTGAMEEVLSEHPDIAECAVIGVNDDLKGQLPLGFICLNSGVNRNHEEIISESISLVRDKIGPVASFKMAVIIESLPKTRSGKIMRRILRKIADGDFANLGDTSTLADPSVVEDLIASREIYEK